MPGRAGKIAKVEATVQDLQEDQAMQIIGLLVVGLIIGALARLLKPGKQALSLFATLALGVVGALIGGVIAGLLGTGSIWELDFLGFVVAVIAALLLVGAAEGMTAKKS